MRSSTRSGLGGRPSKGKHGAGLRYAYDFDNDGGSSDYTTSIAIDDAPPSAALNGQATALVDQQVTFVLSATDASADDQADASADDQAAGFTPRPQK